MVNRSCVAGDLTTAAAGQPRMARWAADGLTRPPRRNRTPNRTPTGLEAVSVADTQIQSHGVRNRPAAANSFTAARTRPHRLARWRAGRPPRRTRRPDRTATRLQAVSVADTRIQSHGVVNRPCGANSFSTTPRVATVHIDSLLAAVARCPGLPGCLCATSGCCGCGQCSPALAATRSHTATSGPLPRHGDIAGLRGAHAVGRGDAVTGVEPARPLDARVLEPDGSVLHPDELPRVGCVSLFGMACGAVDLSGLARKFVGGRGVLAVVIRTVEIDVMQRVSRTFPAPCRFQCRVVVPQQRAAAVKPPMGVHRLHPHLGDSNRLDLAPRRTYGRDHYESGAARMLTLSANEHPGVAAQSDHDCAPVPRRHHGLRPRPTAYVCTQPVTRV
jgi:hypothetical protein